jgi:hypothetical protein
MSAREERNDRRRDRDDEPEETPTPTATAAPTATVTETDDSHTGHGDTEGSGGGSDGGGDHEDLANPLFYFDNTPKVGEPETPGRIAPDKEYEMRVFGRDLEMPDGREIEFWGFEDRINRAEEDVIRPSSLIRVTEGDIVHVTVKPSKRQHTLHLHGIEIDTHNDGVGHTSFEVTGSYTYQFNAGAPFQSLDSTQPKTRGAGTYFYHCHVNTTLHFQMGMYGGLIVDPAEGPGTAFHGGPQYDLDSERAWFAGDVDPVWHELGHAAGMKGGDAGLNDFNPVYFDISGKFQPMRNGRTDPDAVIEDPAVATTAEVGGLPTLIRFANSSYGRERVIFHGIDEGSLRVQLIASDGRGFDGQAPNFAQPFDIEGPWDVVSAERYDFLVTALQPGTSLVTIEHRHWITGELLGVCRTTVTAV